MLQVKKSVIVYANAFLVDNLIKLFITDIYHVIKHAILGGASEHVVARMCMTVCVGAPFFFRCCCSVLLFLQLRLSSISQ